MRHEPEKRTLQSSGALSQSSFGFSTDAVDQAFLASLLRNKLYSNKVLAVLREYSTNAVDAHIEAGIPERPIRVHMPTTLDSAFSVRDYGFGLSEHDIFNTYAKYTRSTKRGSNAQLGAFGLGCKAGFAYADQFSIISRHEGVKSIYAAALDESDIGVIIKQWEGPTDEPSGIEIKIPVNPKDIDQFYRNARGLYTCFDVLPEFNIKNFVKPLPQGKVHWSRHMFEHSLSRWFVIMGGVPYALDITELANYIDEEQTDLIEALKNNYGFVRVGIGDVDIIPSREGLEFNKRTVEGVVACLHEGLEEYYEAYRKEVGAISGSELWSYVREKAHRSSLPTPKEYKKYLRQNISFCIPIGKDDKGNPIYKTPTSFSLHSWNYGSTNNIDHLDVNTLLVKGRKFFFDDKPANRSYKYYTDYYNTKFLIRALGEKTTREEAIAEFNAWLAEQELSPLSPENLSTLEYNPPPPKMSVSATSRAKYSKNLFRWKGTGSQCGSENWILLNEEEEAQGIPEGAPYVFLHRFHPFRLENVLVRENPPLTRLTRVSHISDSNFDRDKEFLAAFNEKLPTIYGVKETVKAPADPSLHAGVFYPVWRKEHFLKLLADDTTQEALLTASAFRLANQCEIKLDRITNTLGKHHRMLVFLRSLMTAQEIVTSLTWEQHRQLKAMEAVAEELDMKPLEGLDEIYKRWPLLEKFQNEWVSALNECDPAFIDYLKR